MHMLFVCIYIYIQICRDIYSEHFSKWIFKCRSHQFDPRTWECLKYLGSTGSFTSQETSQWRNWVSFKVACEFWVAQTLITLLKVIELIRLVKISTDLLLYFPKDLHKTWELLDNNHNYKTWCFFTGEEPRVVFVFPRGKTWCPTSKTFLHATPRCTSAPIHGLDIPWRIVIPSGPFGWFVKGIVRYGVVLSNIFLIIFPRKLGKIPILTYVFQRGSIYIQ